MRTVLLIASFVWLFACSASARPWCNAENLNPTETTICGDSTLRRLDEEMQIQYNAAKLLSEHYGQLGWLQSVRNACGGRRSCLEIEYSNRISILRARLSANSVALSRPWCTAPILNETEGVICATASLRDLDAKMQVLYGQARAMNVAHGQLTWLRRSRNSCNANKNCISEQYENRINLLTERVDAQREAIKIIPRTPERTERPQVNRTTTGTLRVTAPSCSSSRRNELQAVCVISALGERGCANELGNYIPNGGLQGAATSGICSAAASHLITGEIDPETLGLSIASGFADGIGDSLLESDDPFDQFFGVVFKLGSVGITAATIDKCLQNVERVCR